tara:strand:- start:18 stop:365 length:348 start_codon:yes stop_codon:yes gene_type:complete
MVKPLLEVAEMAGCELPDDIGTLERGKKAAPRVKQWQQQVAWRWQRMARRAQQTGGMQVNEVQRFPPGVPISRVILVGGATRMPCIGRFIKRMTGLTAKARASQTHSAHLSQPPF